MVHSLFWNDWCLYLRSHFRLCTGNGARNGYDVYANGARIFLRIHDRSPYLTSFINKKIKAAFANDLKPIVCVGETLEQREANQTQEIITKQTELALEGLTEEQVQNTIIAYEPIWAIGTGKTATSEQANDAIKSIRDKICQIYGQNVANGVIIQYGGSVKSSNAKELFEMSDIDGGLVGGASLKSDEFAKIVNYAD